MSRVLVDSSVWIEYFRGSKSIGVSTFNELLDNNQLCINDLILSELLPSILHQKEYHVVDLLKSINNIPIIIDWYEIIDFQTKNIKNGYNNIGIPDLIIIQNVLQNNLVLYSIDKHFTFLQKLYKFKLL
ncbi:MAG TPA: PIN domain-containing protein [Spirochaetota bacterium]|nr:PIN domain-containing protein [Spirochaetota bacterium]HQP48385.1 PIN domain-containing protein [Spirochaetota bacterium]